MVVNYYFLNGLRHRWPFSGFFRRKPITDHGLTTYPGVRGSSDPDPSDPSGESQPSDPAMRELEEEIQKQYEAIIEIRNFAKSHQLGIGYVVCYSDKENLEGRLGYVDCNSIADVARKHKALKAKGYSLGTLICYIDGKTGRQCAYKGYLHEGAMTKAHRKFTKA